jgi:protein SDA1
LAICAQGAHDQVPPEYLESIVMIIANKFVNDHSSPEAISAGLNTIREICARQPLVMSQTLLSDLTRYIKSKNKYIVNSARGLVTLFREVDPLKLRRRDRGKGTDLTKTAPVYGSSNVEEGIDGLDLLEQFKQGKIGADELNDLSSGSEDDLFEENDGDDGSDSDGQIITEDDILNAQMVGDNDDDDEDNDDDDDEDDDEEGEDGVDENGIVWKIKKVSGSDQDDSEEEDEEDDMMGGENIENSEGDEEEGEEMDSDEEDDMMGGEPIENSDEMDSEEGSEDGEEEDGEEEEEKEEEEKYQPSFSANAILTQDDFDLIKKLKKLKTLKQISKKKMKPKEFIDLADIETTIKKKRKDLIADGEMPEKEKTKWERRKKEAGSKSNLEKRKNKPFMMKKYSTSVRKKAKMGSTERHWRKEKAKKKQIKFALKHH